MVYGKITNIKMQIPVILGSGEGAKNVHFSVAGTLTTISEALTSNFLPPLACNHGVLYTPQSALMSESLVLVTSSCH